MNQPSKIPLVPTTNGGVLPGDASRVVLSSACANWHNLVVEEHHFPSRDLEVDNFMYIQHVVVVNVGRQIATEFKKDGRIQRISKARSAVSLFPSHQPFFRRMKKEAIGSADVLYVAVDPVLVSHTAEALEIYPDRIELVERQGDSDPALLHIAMALRAGVQAGHTGDRMYGEALSTALAVHLLREYGAETCRGATRASRAIQRETDARD